MVTGGVAVLDDDETLFAVRVERGRVAQLVFVDDVSKLQEAATRIFEGGAGLGVRVHLQHEIGGRHSGSNMNNVTLEALPVDLLVVELNERPVLREGFVAGADGNRRGVEDMSQDSLDLCAPEPRSLNVEHI